MKTITDKWEMLKTAVKLAIQHHEGQTDKQNVPAIFHPLRVMADVLKETNNNPEYATVAVLHDTLEDTALTSHDLARLGFPAHIIEAVQAVTKAPEENYIKFVRRAKQNTIGKVVKLADVKDNRNRIPRNFNSKWWHKLELKYTAAIAILNDDQDWLNTNQELIAGLENS